MVNKYENLTALKAKQITKSPFFAFIVFGIILILLQLIAITGAIKSNVINGLAMVLIYSIVGFGFTYLMGYAGLASLGTAGIVGLGAYLSGFILKTYTTLPYIVVILAVLAVSIVLGVIIGFISLRIEGIFLAIVTLGLSEVLYQIFNNWIDFTGGPNGLSINFHPIFQQIFKMKTIDARRAYFVFIVILTVFIMVITYNLCKSSTGRAMLAMKNSTSAAQAMGISLLKYRLLAFILSTVYAALGGILYFGYNKAALPNSFMLMFSLNILCAVIIGGTRNMWGTIFGTFVVFGINSIFLQKIPFFNKNSWLIYVVIGIIIILVIMFYQGGVVQLVGDIKKAIEKATAKRRLYKYGEDD